MSFERLRHSFSASNCVDHDIEGETTFGRLLVSPFITGFPKDPRGYLVLDGRDDLMLSKELQARPLAINQHYETEYFQIPF